MAELLTPDLCVIGAGSGGLSVAVAAAALGVSVVLIEKHRTGGDCLNTGCVPSKALLAAAESAARMRDSAALGVTPQAVAVDAEGVFAHVRRTIAGIAPNDSAERLAGLGVRVIKGEGRFADAETVTVDAFAIKARRFVIATGSVPAIPSIEGLDGVPYLTNETVFDLTSLPQHLVIVGAGPIGLELAQAFRRLGSRVTVIEAAQPLAKEDPECVAVVLDQLAREDISLRPATSIVRVMRLDSAGSEARIGVVLNGEKGEETIEASDLLVATGRRVVTDGLGLDLAGISRDSRGIVVDKRLRTANKRVYAIGDAAGGAQFTHLANYHAGLVIRNALFRLPVTVNDAIVPRVTFTDPELAHIGLTEAEARKHHRAVRILRAPFHDNDRAQTEGDTRGHIKVVTTARGQILGATIVGRHAGELIAMWSLAVSQGLNIRALPDVVLPYPTRAEIGKRAAIDFFTPRLTGSMLRRILSLLRSFG
jgi:pyruvate/2-oxoglutarate dehydrogenase complex dihydrolipoamide dehydrogenase (E3) component